MFCENIFHKISTTKNVDPVILHLFYFFRPLLSTLIKHSKLYCLAMFFIIIRGFSRFFKRVNLRHDFILFAIPLEKSCFRLSWKMEMTGIWNMTLNNSGGCYLFCVKNGMKCLFCHEMFVSCMHLVSLNLVTLKQRVIKRFIFILHEHSPLILKCSGDWFGDDSTWYLDVRPEYTPTTASNILPPLPPTDSDLKSLRIALFEAQRTQADIQLYVYYLINPSHLHTFTYIHHFLDCEFIYNSIVSCIVYFLFLQSVIGSCGWSRTKSPLFYHQ